MRKHILWYSLLAAIVVISGCAQPAAPTVSPPILQSPQNGRAVPSLTPILTWTAGTADATYRIQLATDNGFQNLLVDEGNIAGESYSVPSGKLPEGQTVYWKVRTYKGNESSSWSPFWSFVTPVVEAPPLPPAPGTGNIVVDATLDGFPWGGSVSYTISGPKSYTGASVTQSFSQAPPGDYKVGYSFGGPGGATFQDITPNSLQPLSAGGTTTFTLNFSSEPTTAIRVHATLDGSSWSGDLLWRGAGPTGESAEFDEVPETFSNLTSGTYSVNYRAGGPSGSTLVSITPNPTQTAIENSTTNFTFNFITDATSDIRIKATLDGSSWSGSVNYTLGGPKAIEDNRVSKTYYDMPVGTYTLIYDYGGPSNATLASISPQPTQTTSANKTTTFTMNFYSKASSTIRVRATLDGSSWSGDMTYQGSGPRGINDRLYIVPDDFTNLPAGTYSVNYLSGGPPGAQLVNISPSGVQSVNTGKQITFTLNFRSVANGRILVEAMLDDMPWEGAVRFNISGASNDSGSSVPDQFGNLPEGPYTITYLSGGPPSAHLVGIIPGPMQDLSPGGKIRFTLIFYSLGATLPEGPPMTIQPIETVPMPKPGEASEPEPPEET